ncbi:SEL1-like repeat protein [uncultured Ruminobacter sp.]|jgi:TPR repeat protein|uniref:SEL1-like repeat protein n=1 Tax=Ruminobacter sp. TaxID=2774296 RepID=UPI0025F6A59A|nr:SEL1-like repeat protein [uncultured Ruminobacter sp.]
MFLFIIKTLTSFGLIYAIFGFYGNVSDNLFVKSLLCVCILLATYWVDLFRFSRIFLNYFRAVRCLKKGRYYKAFSLFERLLSAEFAPSLPHLARMRFIGLGTNINVNAAKYFSERAIRNDYQECIYLLAVINFFGDSLSEYFTRTYGRMNADDVSAKKNIIKKGAGRTGNVADTEKTPATKKRRTSVHNSPITPDYNECVFHLQSYLEKASETDRDYGDACALMAYCLYTGKGVPKNIEKSNDLFRHAAMLRAKNVDYLKNCALNNTEVSNYSI